MRKVMLAQAEMPVVFVLGETISLGTRNRTAVEMAKSSDSQSRLESATVTESFWKRREWNAVNPSS